MLTQEDTLTLEKAYSLTGEYSAHAGKDYILTQEIKSVTREKKSVHTGQQRNAHAGYIALTRVKFDTTLGF